MANLLLQTFHGVGRRFLSFAEHNGFNGGVFLVVIVCEFTGFCDLFTISSDVFSGTDTLRNGTDSWIDTLGDGTLVMWRGRRGFVLFKIVAISSKSFLVESPACKLGVVVDRVTIKIVMMSVVACFRKSVKLISGKGISFGKKVAVSTSHCWWDFGK